MLESIFGGRLSREPAPSAIPGCDDSATAVMDEPDATTTPVVPAAAPFAAPSPAAPAADEPSPALDAARERIAEVEEQLRSTLERLGRRTTEVRNLEARLKVMDPLIEQVRQRDQWLDEARKEVRRALAERDAEAEKRRAAESDLATLRKEIDWRDYVIRDLEALPEKVRERDEMLAKLRREHASATASRDSEIERLRARVAEIQRGGARFE